RYEHKIMSRERFEKNFTDSSVVVQQRGAKIATLKAKLEKAEREAVKASKLCGCVSELEAEGVAIFKEDAAAWHFEERAAELEARIAEVKRDMDTDLYPYMLTAIAGQRWSLVTAFVLP
ncbi:hypothetical protein Tco_0118683, partial [Tanacetum coccineum]